MPFFQPTDLSGCFAWYKASDINFINGSGVSYWQDASGSGNHMNLITSGDAFKPTYQTNILNGYPVVKFDGYSNGMHTSGTLAVLSASGFTGFTVFKANDYVRQQFLVGMLREGSLLGAVGVNVSLGLNGNLFGATSGWYTETEDTNGVAFYTASGTLYDYASKWTLRTDRFDTIAKDYVISRDGSEIASGVITLGSPTNANFRLRVAQDKTAAIGLSGSIAEIVFYNRALNYGDTTKVNDYLRQKYNLGPVSNIPLFMSVADDLATTGIYNDLPLYTYGFNPANSGLTLYEYGYDSGNINTPLYIGSTTQISGSKTLWVGASTPINSSTSLYMLSIGSGNNNIALYVGSTTPINSGIPLCTSGAFWINNNIPLYLLPTLAAVSGISLWVGPVTPFSGGTTLYVGNSTPLSGNTTLFTMGAFFSTSGFPMYMIAGYEQKTFPLFVWGDIPVASSISLYVGNAQTGINNIPLFIWGNSSGHSTMPLMLYNKFIPAPTGHNSIPLSVFASTAGTSGLLDSIPLSMVGLGQLANMPLYLQTTPVPTGVQLDTAPFPLFLQSVITTGTNANSIQLVVGNYFTAFNGPRLKMFVDGDGIMDGASVGNSNMPLYLNRPAGNIMSLYVASNNPNASLPLYMASANMANSGVLLYVGGIGQSSGIPCYIAGPSPFSSGLNMFISGLPTQVNNIILYSHGF